MYNIVFLGGNPKNTPAIYAMMGHIDYNLGVWYPLGGIGKITKALVSLCQRYNVKILYNTPVTAVQTKNKSAIGVKTRKRNYHADFVISNADYAHTEIDLLDKSNQTYPKSYWQKKTIAPSAFIMYLGINKKINKLAHHNLFLAHDWIKHFNDIFEHPAWPENPSYYICCPSKTDPSVAPEGHENLFILVPTAPDMQDTTHIRKEYSKKIIRHVESILGQNIHDSITTYKTFAHNDFTTLFNAYKGTALGLSHTLMQSALFRPGHKSKKIHNLYYTGQYTHPGIGVPTALISAQITAKKIMEDTEV